MPDKPSSTRPASPDEIVVIAGEEFRRLQGAQTGRALVDMLKASPHRDIDFAVPASQTAPVREVKQ